MRLANLLWGFLVVAGAFSVARADVSYQDSLALKSKLTPVGAERGGNSSGTLPAWTGGYTTVSAGYREGDARPDPFAAEKPILAITSRNFRDYADKLPEGARFLFEKYPDYRMDIYPTHRSAAAPGWVYDNILRNATRAHAAPEGIVYGVEGAVGGVPFPIPKDGYEAMWNHLLAFWGPARELEIGTYVVSADGTVEKTKSYKEIADFPVLLSRRHAGFLRRLLFQDVAYCDIPARRRGRGLPQLAAHQYQALPVRRVAFAARRASRARGAVDFL